MDRILIFIVTSFLLGCSPDFQKSTSKKNQIEIIQRDALTVISKDASITIIARGFTWSEGPLWLESQKALIFSDVPENKIYQWTEIDGLATWLQPSGYTGLDAYPREGSNGLLLDTEGNLIICQHGDRRIARMEKNVTNPVALFTTIADHWRDKKLNSPNDAAYYKGDLYFTDPPYGLPGHDQSPDKEIDFSGVYRVSKNGLVILLEDSLSRPNGIAFNVANQAMYIANSDPDHAVWMKYDMTDQISPKRSILYNATTEAKTENGLPDGLKVHPTGYVFATGPGGIWIFSPEDKLCARIYLQQHTSNCTFDDTFSNLYVTADSLVYRISLNTNYTIN